VRAGATGTAKALARGEPHLAVRPVIDDGAVGARNARSARPRAASLFRRHARPRDSCDRARRPRRGRWSPALPEKQPLTRRRESRTPRWRATLRSARPRRAARRVPARERRRRRGAPNAASGRGRERGSSTPAATCPVRRAARTSARAPARNVRVGATAAARAAKPRRRSARGEAAVRRASRSGPSSTTAPRGRAERGIRTRSARAANRKRYAGAQNRGFRTRTRARLLAPDGTRDLATSGSNRASGRDGRAAIAARATRGCHVVYAEETCARADAGFVRALNSPVLPSRWRWNTPQAKTIHL